MRSMHICIPHYPAESNHLLGSIRSTGLETGIRQPESLGLYRKLGYVGSGPFGDYGADPHSAFMEEPGRAAVREPFPFLACSRKSD